MNNNLLREIILTNSDSCPELVYENSLLDRNIAKTVAESFLKILNSSSRHSSSYNLNIRMKECVLHNLRGLCKIEPENHVALDEEVSQSLFIVFKEYVEKLQSSLETKFTSILRMTLLDMDIAQKTSINPEIRQALTNFEVRNSGSEMQSNSCFHAKKPPASQEWLFSHIFPNNSGEDISIQVKRDVEKHLLQLCHEVLTYKNSDDVIKKVFKEKNSFTNIVAPKCTISCYCFQICCSILNSMLVLTNFNPRIAQLIGEFIIYVKQHCNKPIAFMYQTRLQSLVSALDIDLTVFTDTEKEIYFSGIIQHFKHIQQYNILMLLSHFPNWQIYCNQIIRNLEMFHENSFKIL